MGKKVLYILTEGNNIAQPLIFFVCKCVVATTAKQVASKFFWCRLPVVVFHGIRMRRGGRGLRLFPVVSVLCFFFNYYFSSEDVCGGARMALLATLSLVSPRSSSRLSVRFFHAILSRLLTGGTIFFSVESGNKCPAPVPMLLRETAVGICWLV